MRGICYAWVSIAQQGRRTWGQTGQPRITNRIQNIAHKPVAPDALDRAAGKPRPKCHVIQQCQLCQFRRPNPRLIADFLCSHSKFIPRANRQTIVAAINPVAHQAAQCLVHGPLMLNRRTETSGQGLVEFALVFPIFVIMLFGLFDVGRAVFAYNAITNSAREGTRLGIVNQDVATIRIHDPAKAYAVVATAVTRARAASLGIDRDGRQAAYAVYGPPASSGVPRILPSTIVVLRIADGRETATFPGYAGYNALDFTPDGRSLLLQTGFCGSNWSIGVGALDGTVRSIATGGFMVGKFSPDGSQVGFTRGTELWVVASDGNTPARRLAEGIHGPAGFDWSPDSKWISVPPFFGGFDWCP